jgi:hypothetical protein
MLLRGKALFLTFGLGSCLFFGAGVLVAKSKVESGENLVVNCVIAGTSVGFQVESATGSFESTLESIAKIEEEKANYTVSAKVRGNLIQVRSHSDNSVTTFVCATR